MVASAGSGRRFGGCRAAFTPLAAFGAKDGPNSSSSRPCASRASAADGCAPLHTPWFLESRMPNERCTSGSEGGRQKPTAATPHGADARPYPYIPIGRGFLYLVAVM